jgi:DNA-directed RNA polymerase subunit N (RpoN/RPB10)
VKHVCYWLALAKMEPICCYECGSPISDKWDAFLILREAWLEELDSQEVDHDKKFIDPDLNQNLLPIFKAFDIEKYCCRKIFTAAKNIHKF